MSRLLRIVKRAGNQFIADRCSVYAAAISYSGALSLAPLMILAMWAFDQLDSQIRQQAVQHAQKAIGPQAGAALTVISSASQDPHTETVAGWVSLAVLAFSATAVLVQLQGIMNHIWCVKSRPGHAIRHFLVKRLQSLVLLMAMGAVLVASLVATSALAALSGRINLVLPGAAWQWIDLVVSILILTVAFGLLFKMLPDAQLTWGDVGWGAALTAVLLAIGKIGIAFYIARAGMGSRYGAAGVLVAMLVWMYLAAMIVLFGVELTDARVRESGRSIEPAPHAVRIERA